MGVVYKIVLIAKPLDEPLFLSRQFAFEIFIIQIYNDHINVFI